MKRERAAGPSGAPFVRYAPYILSAFAVVVASFLASTYYTLTRLADVDRQSSAITRNAMPTIVHLAILRTRLRDLEAALDDLATRDASPAAARRSLDGMDAELAAGTASLSSRDDGIWKSASDQLASVRDDARSLLALDGMAASPKGAELMGRVSADIARADHELADSIESDAVRGRDRGARLEQAQHRVSATALVLDIASFALSVVVALAALRVVRTSVALSEQRADELELFASRMAHDVRGPLTPALLALQRGMKELGPEHRLRPAFESGVRCLLLVGTIVDGLFAFAKSGARPERDAEAPLRDAIEGVVMEVASFAAERGVAVEVESIPEARLRCAPGVLVSILSNLVRNAVKYVGDGPVRRVTLRAGRGRHSSVRVEVSDTGPGLPVGREQAIFDPYVRGPGKKDVGLGLGLATVRRLVESHEGRVGADSRASGGCVFWFELPAYATGEHAKREPERLGVPQSSARSS